MKLMGYKAAADKLGVKLGTLYAWVSRQGKGADWGPPFIRLSPRCVRFDEEQVDEWLKSRGGRSANTACGQEVK